MKTIQSILFCLIPLFAWPRAELLEEFEFDGGITSIQLLLFADSSFTLRVDDQGGIVDFKGRFTYNQDTLLLTKTDWEWFSTPVRLKTKDGDTVPDKPVFQFSHFLRQEDKLYLMIDKEMIEPEHLQKAK